MKDKARATNSANTKLRTFIRDSGCVLIFAVILVFAIIFVPNFVNSRNFLSIIKQAAIPMIAGIGVTFVLITGGIDLSTGYMVGLTSSVMGELCINRQMSALPTIVLVLLTGAICGLINGALVQAIKIPPFITTLGTGYIFYGVAQIISNGNGLKGVPDDMMAMGRTMILNLPSYVYICIAIAIIFYVLMHLTTFGRNLCATGLNLKASKMSGVKTGQLTTMVYSINGLLAAAAGILLTIRVNNAQPTMGGTDFTFDAVVAAVLGGASMLGGKGSVWGAALGVLTLTIIENCITLLSVDAYIVKALIGFVILLAIIFDNVKNRFVQ